MANSFLTNVLSLGYVKNGYNANMMLIIQTLITPGACDENVRLR